ncbi:uncharacterized protein J4E92_004527 [Alternaria infectoria]|uniref:uncharacterized protein n=2 Tax=Alternaria sect. Infectoriae TaxID=2499258 RepID=UPI0022207760|nr:uncharacterized protein J4E92_004527 [Alternaria infectoria]KAI4930695.1 hypothetical protein J4E92_004527 [Alternaria infectoria]
MDESNRITITVCGDGGCGKSSITLRLVRSQWTSEYDPTIEDSYSVTRTVDGVPYYLMLTDTAGQEEYRGLWAASNLQSDAFLLVYDITSANSLDALDYFMEMIEMETENRLDNGKIPPIKCVVGNKCDLQGQRQVEAKTGLEWARRRKCGFMETSAREMVNIEETFALLVRRVVEARRLTAGDGPANRTAALPLQSHPNRDPNSSAAYLDNEKDDEDEPKKSWWRRLKKSRSNMSKPHIEEELPVQDGLSRTLKDLFAGAVGGVAQVLIGQPFDIVKVRLQTTSQYSGALDAATKIYQNEGALAFYKGTLTPLIGIGACVSIQFGGFHYARRAFEASNEAKTGKGQLSYSQYYAAGAFAGIANTVLSSPIEHIRIRLQTQPHGPNRLYAGPIDCVRKLSAHQGVLGGVYRGTAVTFMREAQAYGCWFTAFEYMMNADAARNGIDRKEISTLKVAAYGGLAGEVLWISSYPFDVIKSKMQSDAFGKDQKYKSMRDCFAKTYKGEGLGGFWRGIGPTLLRAMPVSAGTFATVEVTMRLIS